MVSIDIVLTLFLVFSYPISVSNTKYLHSAKFRFKNSKSKLLRPFSYVFSNSRLH